MIWFYLQRVRILLSCGKIGDKHVPEICWSGRGNLIFSPFFLEAKKYVNIIFSSRTAITIIVHRCSHYGTVTRNGIALRLVSCRWMKFLTHIIPVLHVGICILRRRPKDSSKFTSQILINSHAGVAAFGGQRRRTHARVRPNNDVVLLCGWWCPTCARQINVTLTNEGKPRGNAETVRVNWNVVINFIYVYILLYTSGIV